MDDQRTNREGRGMKQFSIRDLLFLVVIVALILGWSLDRRTIVGRFQAAVSGRRVFLTDTATGQIWTDHPGRDDLPN